MQQFNDAHRDVVLELSMRRGLVAALDALTRDELDGTFGRPHDLDRPWPGGTSRRLVCLEPLSCMVVEGHPLADATRLGPEDLLEWGVWWPLDGSPAELLGFFRSFCEEHGLPTDCSGPNLGLSSFVHALHDRPERVSLVGSHWELPAGAGVRRIPFEPVPSYPWHFAWNATDIHPVVRRMLAFFRESIPIDAAWTDPSRVWLPSVDRAEFDRSADDPGATWCGGGP